MIRQLPSGAKILDVGCGLGREAFALADLGFDVVGIDISKEAITQVAQLSADKGYTIPFLDYDGESLPFGDETFDVVVIWAQTFGLLYGNAAKQRYLTECKRVLRTGDLCSFSTHDYQFLKKTYQNCMDDRKFYPYAKAEIYRESFEAAQLTQFAEGAGMELLLCEKGNIYKPEDGTILRCLCGKDPQ